MGTVRRFACTPAGILLVERWVCVWSCQPKAIMWLDDSFISHEMGGGTSNDGTEGGHLPEKDQTNYIVADWTELK